ncbi:UspA domain-containing protein [Calothrix sp. NIES-4071]|nr:UspA domain-containing protein [Calothrix sp. NIES-4071]BAZ55344.1 UspA domain-containing protein [Calothrix sp. NIES-4105]
MLFLKKQQQTYFDAKLRRTYLNQHLKALNMIDKILVAIDNFDTCQQVVDKAVSLASLTAANLMLVNVISPFDEVYRYPMYVYPNTVIQTLHEEVANEYLRQSKELKQNRIKFLNQLCQHAIDLGINAKFTLLFGDPDQIICEIAQTWNANLIIIGRNSRTGLNELFLGCLSHYRRLRVYEVH